MPARSPDPASRSRRSALRPGRVSEPVGRLASSVEGPGRLCAAARGDRVKGSRDESAILGSETGDVGPSSGTLPCRVHALPSVAFNIEPRRSTLPARSPSAPSHATRPFAMTTSIPVGKAYGAPKSVLSLTVAGSNSTRSPAAPSSMRPRPASANRSAGSEVIFRTAASGWAHHHERTAPGPAGRCRSSVGARDATMGPSASSTLLHRQPSSRSRQGSRGHPLPPSMSDAGRTPGPRQAVGGRSPPSRIPRAAAMASLAQAVASLRRRCFRSCAIHPTPFTEGLERLTLPLLHRSDRAIVHPWLLEELGQLVYGARSGRSDRRARNSTG